MRIAALEAEVSTTSSCDVSGDRHPDGPKCKEASVLSQTTLNATAGVCVRTLPVEGLHAVREPCGEEPWVHGDHRHPPLL